MNKKKSHLIIGGALLIVVTAIFATVIVTAQTGQAATSPSSSVQANGTPIVPSVGNARKGSVFGGVVIHGVIQSIDTGNMSFTLKVTVKGKTAVNATPGISSPAIPQTRTVTVLTTSTTRFFGTTGSGTASFSALQQNDYVLVRGTPSQGHITATEVSTVPGRKILQPTATPVPVQ